MKMIKRDIKWMPTFLRQSKNFNFLKEREYVEVNVVIIISDVLW